MNNRQTSSRGASAPWRSSATAPPFAASGLLRFARNDGTGSRHFRTVRVCRARGRHILPQHHLPPRGPERQSLRERVRRSEGAGRRLPYQPGADGRGWRLAGPYGRPEPVFHLLPPNRAGHGGYRQPQPITRRSMPSTLRFSSSTPTSSGSWTKSAIPWFISRSATR